MPLSQPFPIYTIGYGNRTFDDFIALLRQYEIDYLVDVRSAAYSKYNQDFSQYTLRAKLQAQQIGYLFMGDQLGGKPTDGRFYTNGKVDYDLLQEADFYQAGILRLKIALEKEYRVALMCSELKPELCHRTKLIGQTLDQQHVPVQHIDEAGVLIGQAEAMRRLTGGQLSFLEPVLTSNKRYRPNDD
jgi:uncharacterized protein (DUF488 family)